MFEIVFKFFVTAFFLAKERDRETERQKDRERERQKDRMKWTDRKTEINNRFK